jgi:hypothetical protein
LAQNYRRLVMDELTAKRIEDILYCVGMSADISTDDLKMLCWAAGVPFPPKPLHPISIGKPAPVTLAFN